MGRNFNRVFLHSDSPGNSLPDRVLSDSDYDLAESEDYKKKCMPYYHAHHILDLEYEYKGWLEEFQVKITAQSKEIAELNEFVGELMKGIAGQGVCFCGKDKDQACFKCIIMGSYAWEKREK